MKILMIPAELVDPVDKLSANTLRRCQAGLEAWVGGDYEMILLSGGIFLPRDRQTKPAAETMKEWFVSRGVDPEVILVEGDSLDTYENVRFNASLTRDQITVLTQYQHAIRFLLTFYLALGVRIKVIPIRQPAMSWKDWFMEWLVLIPYHLIDWKGTLFLARYNRRSRERAAAT